MKFTANTKPILEGLDYCIISENISKFFQKSTLVELTIEDNALRINTEAPSIKSELVVAGKTSGDGENHIFVDSTQFKNLIKSIDTDTIDFEIKDSVLIVYSGKSDFKLPQIVGDEGLNLDRPSEIENVDGYSIDSGSWKFIKDQQMYAIAVSFTHPVYTNVWLGGDKDVLVSDFDNSIFTRSKKSALDSECLISDTIVNLLTSIPEEALITQVGKNYEVLLKTDPFTYTCEFSPKYEDDENVGSYSSPIILALFDHDDKCIEIDINDVVKYISQAEIFSTNSEDTINLVISGKKFTLKNANVNCVVELKDNPFEEDFEVSFKIKLLKDAITHMDEDKIKICPLVQDGEDSGIILYTKNMSTVIGGTDE